MHKPIPNVKYNVRPSKPKIFSYHDRTRLDVYAVTTSKNAPGLTSDYERKYTSP